MSRSIFLTKTEDSRPLDLVGIVSGASYDKKVFASSCYAHALENDVTRQSVERHIGDQTLEFVFRHYPHVKIVFDKYSRVQMDIPRQSDD